MIESSEAVVGRVARIVIGLCCLVAALPVFLGSLIYGLAAYVGGRNSIANPANILPSFEVLSAFEAHIFFAALVTIGSVIGLIVGQPLSRRLLIRLSLSLVAILILIAGDFDFVTFHSFTAGYSWPAIVAATILLSTNVIRRLRSASCEGV